MTTNESTTATVHAKICPECGATFHTANPVKVFCTEQHRVAYANRCLSRGKPVVPLLVTWRRHRNADIGKQALRELCRIASMYIDEDRKDGRESAIQVEALLTGIHIKKFDRPLRSRKGQPGSGSPAQ